MSQKSTLPENKAFYALHLFAQASALRNLKLICPICSCALKGATETLCHHLFCEDCIADLIKQTPSPSVCLCPVCQAPVNKPDLKPSTAMRTTIEELEVRCIHPQCTEWHGKRRELEDHVKLHCEYTLVPCGDCSQTMMRRQLGAHWETDCPSRGIRCVFCNKVEKASELARHDSRCDLKPVKCTGKCDERLVLARKQMVLHQEQSCPNQCIPCPLLAVGCTIRPPRRDMEAHLSDAHSLPKHLRGFEVVAEKLQRFETQLQEQQEATRQLREQFNASATFFREQIGQLQRDVAELRQVRSPPHAHSHSLTPSSSNCSTSTISLELPVSPSPMGSVNFHAAELTASATVTAKRPHAGFFFWWPEMTEPPQIGDVLDVRDSQRKWQLSRIIDQTESRLHVHYLGWGTKWNEWLSPTADALRLQPALSNSRYADNWSRGREDGELMTQIIAQPYQKGWGCCGSLRHQSVCTKQS